MSQTKTYPVPMSITQAGNLPVISEISYLYLILNGYKLLETIVLELETPGVLSKATKKADDSINSTLGYAVCNGPMAARGNLSTLS